MIRWDAFFFLMGINIALAVCVTSMFGGIEGFCLSIAMSFILVGIGLIGERL
jgi:hypothetical protein